MVFSLRLRAGRPRSRRDLLARSCPFVLFVDPMMPFQRPAQSISGSPRERR